MDYDEYSTFMKICSIFGIVGSAICAFVQLVAPAFFVSHGAAYPKNGYDYLFSGTTALFGRGTYRDLSMEASGNFVGNPSPSALAFFIISIIACALGVLALIAVKKFEIPPILLIILLAVCALGMIIGFFMNFNDTVIKEFANANNYKPLYLSRHPLHYLVVVANLFAILGFGYPAAAIIYYLFH